MEDKSYKEKIRRVRENGKILEKAFEEPIKAIGFKNALIYAADGDGGAAFFTIGSLSLIELFEIMKNMVNVIKNKKNVSLQEAMDEFYIYYHRDTSYVQSE